MPGKNTPQLLVDLMGKGFLIGVGLAGIKWLLETQQKMQDRNLQQVTEIVSELADRTVATTGETLMATMRGSKDDMVEQAPVTAESDPMNSQWTLDHQQEDFDGTDWTDTLMHTPTDTMDGHRVMSVAPGEPLIPGIPRPDLGGEEFT